MSQSAGTAIWFLLGCTAKITALLAVAFVTAVFLRRKSAAIRHQVWALAIAASTALPVLTLWLPAWHSLVLNSAARLWNPVRSNAGNSNLRHLPGVIVDAATAAPVAGRLTRLLLALWALGALFLLLRLLAGAVRLSSLSSRAKILAGGGWSLVVRELSDVMNIVRPVLLLESCEEGTIPMTWGIFRPSILLPARAHEWSVERRNTVLSHELAHISRQDWLFQVCAEVVRALYWFHPLVWLAAASLRHESELACDDAVLISGVSPSGYANQLLELARTLHRAKERWSVALAFARPTNLERRFMAMLDPTLNRSSLSRRSSLLVKIATLCLLLPLAALRLPGQNPAGQVAGSIYDVSDGTVPNATIMMINHQANTNDMTASNAEGRFIFKALPSGEYEMKVLKPGFAVYRAEHVVLEPGRDLTLKVKLEVGSISESVDVQAKTPSASSESKLLPKPTRIRIGGNVEAARIVTKVQPIYPEAAKAAGSQGSVVLHAVVGMDGRPLSLQVLNSQIDPELARAAVEAVNQWRYSPTLLNGEPIEVDTTITINFTLKP